MKKAESKLASESFETLPQGPPEMTEPRADRAVPATPGALEMATGSKPREVDGWHFKAHTMPPGLRMELVAAELPEVPEAELYRAHGAPEPESTGRPPEGPSRVRGRRVLMLAGATLGAAVLAAAAWLAWNDADGQSVGSARAGEGKPAHLGTATERAALRGASSGATVRAAKPLPDNEATVPPRAVGSAPLSSRPERATKPSPTGTRGSVEPTGPGVFPSAAPVNPAATGPTPDDKKSWVKVRD
jgi:hypothetical protein